MTSARPIPFSAKAQRRAARAALVARCTVTQPPLPVPSLFMWALAAFVFVVVL
jgi:hypothetical protein